ncbi:MAG: hypothetical protein WC619_01260 [Patescibacteria group bacterium]
MRTGIVELLSRVGKPSSSKPGDPGFKNELVRIFVGFIKTEMTKGKDEEALEIFKTILVFVPKLPPDFVERIFEGAPIFAALVAKMVIDEMMSKLGLEEKRARELQKLAEEYARRSKIVPPPQSI